jgi:hypothetical protein
VRVFSAQDWTPTLVLVLNIGLRYSKARSSEVPAAYEVLVAYTGHRKKLEDLKICIEPARTSPAVFRLMQAHMAARRSGAPGGARRRGASSTPTGWRRTAPAGCGSGCWRRVPRACNKKYHFWQGWQAVLKRGGDRSVGANLSERDVRDGVSRKSMSAHPDSCDEQSV